MSNYPYGDDVGEFHVGDRVAVHPACGYFLAGYHYGDVKAVGSRTIEVELQQLGKTQVVKLHPRNLKVVTD